MVVAFALNELTAALLWWSVEQDQNVEYVVQFRPSAVDTFEESVLALPVDHSLRLLC